MFLSKPDSRQLGKAQSQENWGWKQGKEQVLVRARRFQVRPWPVAAVERERRSLEMKEVGDHIVHMVIKEVGICVHY